jgi:hypothetical protein
MIERVRSGDPETMAKGRQLAATISRDPEMVGRIIARGNAASPSVQDGTPKNVGETIMRVLTDTEEDLSAREIRRRVCAELERTVGHASVNNLIKVYVEDGSVSVDASQRVYRYRPIDG